MDKLLLVLTSKRMTTVSVMLAVLLFLADGETALDVVRAVRERLGRDVPALMLSGDSSAGARSAAGVAGLSMLLKPVDPAELLARIHELLR